MHILNLNNYVPTTDQTKATLKIVPLAAEDGSQGPPLFFIGKRSKRFMVTPENMDDALWNKNVFLDDKLSPRDYMTVVDWWFDKAQEDEEYKEIIGATFKHLNDLSVQINKAHRWLLTTGAHTVSGSGKFNKRKKNIGKFLDHWLNKALDNQMSGRRY